MHVLLDEPYAYIINIFVATLLTNHLQLFIKYEIVTLKVSSIVLTVEENIGLIHCEIKIK